MRTEAVEIYSDANNAAVIRFPGRKFPGVLIQGDSLSILCTALDGVVAAGWGVLPEEEFDELSDVRDRLRAYLNVYKRTLTEHGMKLPFFEGPESRE